jgi:glutamyl-tRNA synthetase
MGYLPVAMRNYLVRLSWSHGDQEFFTTEEMIEKFDTKAIGRSAARFDFKKLENLNGHYMRASSDSELMAAIDLLLPHIEKGADIAARLDAPMRAQLLAAMPGLKERAKTLIELLDGASFLFATRPLAIEEKAELLLAGDARSILGALVPRLEALGDWSAASTEGAVRAFAEETGAKLGQVAQPLRAALTGRTTSPPVFDVLAVLGREESLSRLRDQAV